jgi:predicted nucleic acid-binding protein
VKTRVLDSWAILEWMNNRQPACERVDTLLSEAEAVRTRLLMSAINVGEVYYFLRKQYSVALAELGRFPISYADAFAAALAQKYNCPLVTGDPEFRRVDQLELDWIGSGADPV